jgi:signal transduction histidine kinase
VRRLNRPARVALATAIVTAAAYLALVAAIDLLVADRLNTQVNSQVASALAVAAARSAGGARAAVTVDEVGSRSGLGIFGAPVYLWQLSPTGALLAESAGAPSLGRDSWSTLVGAGTATLIGEPFRYQVVRDGLGLLVAAESLEEVGHLEGVLWIFEGLALPVVLAVVFVAALVVARRAVAPVERARRRELEFTADASHELRTPLSVLRAEIALARSAPTPAPASGSPDAPTGKPTGEPTEAPSADEPGAPTAAQLLDRIDGESARLERIVEDLLFLARSESEPPPPGDEPVELQTLVRQSAQRFEAVAKARRIELRVPPATDDAVLILAPAEWVDRLLGILIDNACRYAADGGHVTASAGVAAPGRRAFVAVEDDGPGIPESERGRVFDRFYRLDERAGGHGLGLAIADSIVQSTGGRWNIGASAAGGARMEVSWPRAGRSRR